MEITRRNFLKVLGTGAAATVSGCSTPLPDKLIPLVIPAEEVVPGEATWYATVCRECPAGCGMLVRAREGRAVKVEGNPDHPVNRGRLCARGQAALQGLYNPDRIRQPLRRSAAGALEPISWEEAEQILAVRVAALQAGSRRGRIAVVAPLVTGSLAQLIETWSQALGGWPPLFVELLAEHALRAANRLTFGVDAIPSYQLENLELLVAFSTDFLETWLSPVGLARQFAAMRAPRDGRMGRFVYLGPRLSMTGANADEWLPLRPGTEGLAALGMVHVILAEGLAVGVPGEEAARLERLVAAYTPEVVEGRSGIPARDLTRLARSLARARPGLAMGGGTVGASRHATATQVAVNLLNYVAGHVGRTVQFGPTSALDRTATYQELLALVQAMERGEIGLLLLAGVNPLFSLPPAAGFQRALANVPLVVSSSSFPDETTAHAHLALPEPTPLESWGDYTPWDGVHGLMQPTMTPLYQTKPLGDVLLSTARRLGGEVAARLPWPTFYDYLRDRWRELQSRLAPDTPFETFWAEALRRGGVWEPIPPKPVGLNPMVFATTFEEPSLSGSRDDPFVLVVYPSIFHYDGRGANRPWLQELPDPVIRVTWDSWVEVNPKDAQRLGITQGDLVALRSPHGQVELPAYLYAGVQPGVVAVPLGQGHTSYGRYAQGRGANPLALLPAEPEPLSGALPWLATRVQVTRTGRRHPLAIVGGSERQEGRGIAQAVSLVDLLRARGQREGAGGQSHAVTEGREGHKALYAPHAHPVHRWGMAIDLNACNGCGACVAACYAENNIPVVGKEQVAKGRVMSWIRIERFIEGPAERPQTRFLPMLCQQCDDAPCEPVCPVYATYHNPEGLNAQVYNRCVGTRYCSNNCPYKVRRFNWFTYKWPEPLHLQLNPDVTVREMGVMEKCTFCVQRIKGGQARAKAEGRKPRDGEIVPACAQSCPAQAIVFGDLNDHQSEVARLARNPRGYRVLEELNTLPAITYLRKVQPEPAGS